MIQSTWHEQVTTEWLHDPGGTRTLLHQGGTRSGKTHNLCIAWIAFLLEQAGNPATGGPMLSITRATGPALKASVRRDVIGILRQMGVYSDETHNKTEDIITLPSGAQIEFFATDNDQKVHGRKRAYLWENEANEIPHDLHRQLVLRTERRVCLDFNPSMREDHWIWRRYDGAQDATWYVSTYLDNPFLSDEQVREIEALKEQDEWAWQVYGLGVRGVPQEAIYREVHPLASMPEGAPIYGLDFGYNDPCVLLRVVRRDGEPRARLCVEPLVHESYLTTSDLLERMAALNIDAQDPIYCDSAEPDRIEQMRRAGYNARPATKGPGSVKAGIDFVRKHRVEVGRIAGGGAPDRCILELKAYRYRKVHGSITDRPADGDDHVADALRYAAASHHMAGPVWAFA